MTDDAFFPSEEIIELRGISWEEYQRFLHKLSPFHLRFTYYQDCLEVMSLSPDHELYKRLLGRFVEILAESLSLKIYPLGSTLFQRPNTLAATPDDCFYFSNIEKIRSKKQLDLRFDPSPDLVIEIDLDNRAGFHLPVYADLGMLEIWLYNGVSLTIYQPQDQAYVPCDRSLIFPQFPIPLIAPLLLKANQKDYFKLIYEIRCWVQDYF